MPVDQLVSLSELVDAFFSVDPKIIDDPYPLFRRLREEAPVFRRGDRVLISRYQEVREVIVAPSTRQPYAKGSKFHAAAQRLKPEELARLEDLFDFFDLRLGGLNGERHLKLRRYMQRATTPRQISAMEERITAIASEQLAGITSQRQFDLVNDFAWHFPLIVICEMFGIPSEDREDLRRWSMDLGRFIGGGDWANVEDLDACYESVVQLRNYLTQLYATAHDEESAGLLGPLITALHDDSFDFDANDLNAVVTQAVFAGHETTTNLISIGAALLLGEHRDQWEMIKADHSLIPGAVEEVLRYGSPAQAPEKIAGEDCEFNGIPVKQYESMIVLLASANRDPAIFVDPDVFDIKRKEAGLHMAFGFGVHSCIGAPLARMEAAIAFKMLAEQFPDMRLIDEQLKWAPNSMLRQLESLDVTTR